MDVALRRPGRFDRELEVTAPSPAARSSILRVALSKMAHTLKPEDITAIAAVLHGFVAADVVAVCQEAAMSVLRRCMAAQPPANNPDSLVVTTADVKAAAAVIKPSGLRQVAIEVPKVPFSRIPNAHFIAVRHR